MTPAGHLRITQRGIELGSGTTANVSGNIESNATLGVVREAGMTIKFADVKIDEATKHLAAIDRELADLQSQLRHGTLCGMGR